MPLLKDTGHPLPQKLGDGATQCLEPGSQASALVHNRAASFLPQYFLSW